MILPYIIPYAAPINMNGCGTFASTLVVVLEVVLLVMYKLPTVTVDEGVAIRAHERVVDVYT